MLDAAVVFVPHPDDEAYAFAGTLAALRDVGWRICVVCLTRGEAGRDRRGPGSDLGATRVAELHASCEAFGADVHVLDLPDGRVAESSLDLSPWAKDAAVVFTLGADGVYGHPDHLACTRMVHAARFDGALLHAAFPRGLFAPVHRSLQHFVRLERAADELGANPADVDRVVDVSPFRDQKLEAIGAHRSQLKGGDPRSFLRPGLVDPLLDEEWFVSIRGDLDRWPLGSPEG